MRHILLLAQDDAAALGQHMGRVIGIVVMCLLVLGAVHLARRYLRR